MVNWPFEGAPPVMMRRAGVEPSLFKIGERVTINWYRVWSTSQVYGHAFELVLPDGRKDHHQAETLMSEFAFTTLPLRLGSTPRQPAFAARFARFLPRPFVGRALVMRRFAAFAGRDPLWPSCPPIRDRPHEL